jgi:hypothetical protein
MRGSTEIDVFESLAEVGRAQRRLLASIQRHSRIEPWVEADCRDMAHWLSINLGMSNYKAQRWVDAAEALERLPAISDALETGVLSLDKVVELARFATPEDEVKLVSWARTRSVTAIKARGDELRTVELDEATQAHSERKLQWWWDDYDRLGLWAVLPAEEGAAVIKAIERIVDSLPDSPTDGEATDPIDARRADALVAMAKAALAEDSDPDRATTLVHVDLDALVGRSGNALIAGGPPIHPEVASRLICDGRIQTVLHDAAGAVVGIGHASRVVPHHIRRLVEHRDGYRCTFPNCGAKRFTEAHHIVPWEFGGPTDLDNLVLICSFHHKLVHEHGWMVSLKPDGTTEWRGPDRTTYIPGPAPPSAPYSDRVLATTSPSG